MARWLSRRTRRLDCGISQANTGTASRKARVSGQLTYSIQPTSPSTVRLSRISTVRPLEAALATPSTWLVMRASRSAEAVWSWVAAGKSSSRANIRRRRSRTSAVPMRAMPTALR